MKQRAILLVLLTLVSLSITPVEAARHKKRKAAVPSSTQAIPTVQVDSCELIAPTPVSSLSRTSHQLLLHDTTCEGLFEVEGSEEELPPVKSQRAAAPKSKKKEKKTRSSHNKKTKDRAEMLEELKGVTVPDSAKEKLGELVNVLEYKGIYCKKTFITMVEEVAGWDLADVPASQPYPKRKRSSKKTRTKTSPEEQASPKLTTQVFLQKANVFFSHMNPRTEATTASKSMQLSTSSLTSVVRTRQNDIASFIQFSDAYLKEVAELEALKTLTSMCANKGFPEELKSYRAFEALFGEGEGKIPGEYRSCFSSMESAKGVPAQKRVVDFWGWIESNELEDILASLSSVLGGKGIPDPNNKKTGSPMQALKDFVRLFGEEKGQIPRKYLSHFTSMQCCRGVPLQARVVNFWQWVKDNELEDILASLSGVLHGKGIPDQNDKEPDSSMQALKDFVGLFGEKKGQIPRKHLPNFTSIQNGKGVPIKERVQNFWQWIEDSTLADSIASLSGVLSGKGIPDPNCNKSGSSMHVLNDFVGLFGEKKGQIPRKHLSHFTSMQYGKGVPAKDRILGFWQWVNDNELKDNLESLSSALNKQGIPDPNNKKQGSPIQALNDFIGLFGEKKGQIPRKHLSQFTSIQNCKGVPTKKRVLDFWRWIESNKLEDILASLAGVLHGKGIPDPKSQKAGSPMQALKDFVGLFGEKKGQIPQEHLPHFTSMQSSKGLPTKERALGFWQWVQDNTLEDILASLSCVLNSKGIPDPNDKKTGSPMQALNDFVGLFGEKRGQIPREYIPHFTSMQRGRGVPMKTRVVNFWQWVKDNEMEDILAFLSSVLSAQGIPDPNNNKQGSPIQVLNDFIGLFGEKKGQIPRKHLSHFTSMQNSTGVPTKKRVLDFWGWIEGNKLEGILTSLASVLHGKGVPDPKNQKAGSPMQALKEFIGLFGEKKGQIPQKQRSHFTSMQKSKGLPAKERVLNFWDWIKNRQLGGIMKSLSCVLNGKGIPDPNDNKTGSPMQALNDFVGLFGEEEGQIPRKYLSHFVSMQHGRGVPMKARVVNFWQWVKDNELEDILASLSDVLSGQGIPDPNDPNKGILRTQGIRVLYAWLGDHPFELTTTMTRFFRRKGLPNLEELKKHQSHIHELTGLPDTEKDPCLKLLALHQAAPGPNRLSEQKMKDYLHLLSQQAGSHEKGARILARLLGQHQRAGMEMYRNLIEKNTGWDPHSIMTLLMEARHLPLARVAIDDIWQGESDHLADARQFLALARNLKPAPTATQWREFKENFVPVLASIILPKKQQSDQPPATVIPERALRLYWESLWEMTAMYRVRFQSEENLRALLKGVRSIAGLHSLARRYETKAFEEQCTCLIDFFQAKRHSPNTVQPLVDAHISLQIPWYEPVASTPGRRLIAEAASASAGSGIRIRLPEQDNSFSQWGAVVGSFVNGLTEGGAHIQQEDRYITLYRKEAAMQVDWPRLSVDETGVSICNWTEEQFDFYGQAYEQFADKESVPDVQGSWSWISNLLQHSGNISSQVWQRLEENRYSLPFFIISLLENQDRPDMPEPLRSYVQSQVRMDKGLAFIQRNESALCGTDHKLPPELQQSLLRELLPGQPVLMESLVKALESKETFSDNELEDVVTRLDINLPSGERERWVGQCNERTQPQASQRAQPLTMEQWADCIGFFEEDDFTDDDYRPEWLLE